MEPLYDSIGTTYGETRRADPEICETLARLVDARRAIPFLDLACGTGNYTCALAALGGSWHGVDASDEMLRQAAPKSQNIEWKRASADTLPYPDGFFGGAICTLAIHHFPELHTPFREVFRVLDRGNFVIFTSFPEQTANYWLAHYFPVMAELSAFQMPTKSSIVEALGDAGFEISDIVPYHVTSDVQDRFYFSGKEHPELYFDPVFRANISSFAVHCSPEELETGLASLRRDIDEGRFQEVTERYSKELGDYVYVVARKDR